MMRSWAESLIQQFPCGIATMSLMPVCPLAGGKKSAQVMRLDSTVHCQSANVRNSRTMNTRRAPGGAFEGLIKCLDI